MHHFGYDSSRSSLMWFARFISVCVLCDMWMELIRSLIPLTFESIALMAMLFLRQQCCRNTLDMPSPTLTNAGHTCSYLQATIVPCRTSPAQQDISSAQRVQCGCAGGHLKRKEVLENRQSIHHFASHCISHGASRIPLFGQPPSPLILWLKPR